MNNKFSYFFEPGAGIRYWLENPGTGVRFPAVSSVFPPLHDLQTPSCAQPTSYSVGTAGFFPREGYSGEDVKLTTVVLRLGIIGDMPPQSYDVVTDITMTSTWHNLTTILLNGFYSKMILFGLQ